MVKLQHVVSYLMPAQRLTLLAGVRMYIRLVFFKRLMADMPASVTALDFLLGSKRDIYEEDDE